MGAKVLILAKILNSKFLKGLRHSAMEDVGYYCVSIMATKNLVKS